MSKIIVKPFVSLAIAGMCALGTALAAPAADPASGAPAVTVRTSDLNLGTPQGVQALYRRIVTAAREVCPQASAWQAESYAAARTCQSQAIERAVRAMNNPHLAALQDPLSRG